MKGWFGWSLLAGTLLACSVPAEEAKTIHCNYSEEGVGWSKAEEIVVRRPELSDNTMSVRTLWDCDSLYIRFDVADTNLQAHQTEKDHPKLFLDDMVEFLIDAEHDRASTWQQDDIVYHINIIGQKKDDKGLRDGKSDATWDGAARYEVTLHGTIGNATDMDDGYTVLVAIPWSEIERTPRRGLEMGINFANGDNDSRGRQLYNWCDADPMRSPNVFGTIILK